MNIAKPSQNGINVFHKIQAIGLCENNRAIKNKAQASKMIVQFCVNAL